MSGTDDSRWRRPTLLRSHFINPPQSFTGPRTWSGHLTYISISESLAHLILHGCLVSPQPWVNSVICFLSLLSSGAKLRWRERCSLLYRILYVGSHSRSSNFSYSPGAPGPRGSFISAGDLTSCTGIKEVWLDCTFHLSHLNFFPILTLPFHK